MSYTASRHHDFSAGHRVVGHEGKCAHFHGHNYRVTLTVWTDQPDDVGRVVDFSFLKELLQLLEVTWDHRMVLWDQDPQAQDLQALDPQGICLVPFNPTAENMAIHLGREWTPMMPAGVRMARVDVQETRKCSAAWIGEP